MLFLLLRSTTVNRQNIKECKQILYNLLTVVDRMNQFQYEILCTVLIFWPSYALIRSKNEGSKTFRTCWYVSLLLSGNLIVEIEYPPSDSHHLRFSLVNYCVLDKDDGIFMPESCLNFPGCVDEEHG